MSPAFAAACYSPQMSYQPSLTRERGHRRVCVLTGTIGIPCSLAGFSGVYFGAVQQPAFTLAISAVLFVLSTVMLWAGLAFDNGQLQTLK